MRRFLEAKFGLARQSCLLGQIYSRGISGRAPQGNECVLFGITENCELVLVSVQQLNRFCKGNSWFDYVVRLIFAD